MNIFTKTQSIARVFLFSLLCTTLSSPAFSQSLFVNGSMTGTVSMASTPSGWTNALNTPDVNSVTNLSINTIWYGTPVASPNGGTFVSLYADNTGYNEAFSQTISGLVIGSTYTFSYQWANTPYTFPSGINISSVGPNVSVTGMSGLSNPPITSTFWNWQTVTQTLTATATSATFIFTSAPSGVNSYLSYDGVSLINPAPPITASSNSPVCAGQTLNLAANTVAGATYSWTSPNSFTSNQQNPVLSNATTAMSGTYIVTGTINGYSDTGVVTVIVHPIPVITASSNSPVCAGQALNLTASTVVGATYSWTGPNSFTIAQQNPVLGNATAAMSGTYTVTGTKNGCSDTGVATVVVNPIPVVTASSNSPVCAGQTLNLTASNITGATYSWTGPNSFTSALQNPVLNNATTAMSGTYTVTGTKNGCSDTGVVAVVVHPNKTGTATAQLCPGSNIVWGGQTITSGGTYIHTFPTSFGCDSIVTLSVTMSNSIQTNFNASICQGSSYTFNSNAYNTAGNYSATFTAVNGCDSVSTLHLSVNTPSSSIATLNLCPSQLPTTWNGITIPAGATSNPAYTTYTTTNAAVCDSIVTLNLTINPSVTNTAFLTKCPSQLPTTWNGITIPAGATSNPAYTTYTTTNVAGCDSIVTLNLTINPSVTNTAFLTKCPSQLPTTWNGITISAGATSNPAFTTYTTTNVAGCDSIVTLNLTVNSSVTNTVFLTKCPSQLPTTWNGITISAGATSNPAFTTYTTTNVAGCDSIVTLNLTVNSSVTNTVFLTKCPSQLPTTWNGITIPAGATSNPTYTAYTTTNVAGCDSIVTLNLIINSNVTSMATLVLCSNQLPATWNGIAIPVGSTSNPAFTTYTTTNAAGCDSTVTLNLNISPSVTSTVSLALCPGQLPITWNGVTIPAGSASNPAFTTYTTTNVAGCDSIVTLNLTINPSINTTVPLTFCPGQLPTTWNGITIPAGSTSNSAFTTYTTTNVAGCDSIVTLNLTISPNATSTSSLTLCPGQLPVTWNGITIPVGSISNPAYTTYSATSALGCDSTVTLNLIINPNVSNSIAATICNGQTYIFGTQTLNASGTYTQVFAAANTCDSTVTLALTIKPPATTLHVNLSGCVSVVFEGTTYTTSTELENTYTDANGCDSVIRKVHITVKQPVINTITADICRGGSYTFNGAVYSNTGTYVDTFTAANGCDSISRLELTVHELPAVTLTEHGTDHPHYCLGDSVNLTASGADNYQWWWRNNSPSLGTGVDKAVPLYATIQKIWVEGSDNYGCSDTAEITIKAQGCCSLMMPNAFSPNGDGMNDNFGPETIGHPKGYAMRIYNRWGQMIYVSYKIEQKWDGTYNGQLAELGTYFYMVTGDCANGEPIQMKGDIILLR
jgi:gliding motility-associated-like protein